MKGSQYIFQVIAKPVFLVLFLFGFLGSQCGRVTGGGDSPPPDTKKALAEQQAKVDAAAKAAEEARKEAEAARQAGDADKAAEKERKQKEKKAEEEKNNKFKQPWKLPHQRYSGPMRLLNGWPLQKNKWKEQLSPPISLFLA